MNFMATVTILKGETSARPNICPVTGMFFLMHTKHLFANFVADTVVFAQDACVWSRGSETERTLNKK